MKNRFKKALYVSTILNAVFVTIIMYVLLYFMGHNAEQNGGPALSSLSMFLTGAVVVICFANLVLMEGRKAIVKWYEKGAIKSAFETRKMSFIASLILCKKGATLAEEDFAKFKKQRRFFPFLY